MANVDLNAITTPLCLLDDETREAIKAHGGPYEFLSLRCKWEETQAQLWTPSLVYRVKPAPKRETVMSHFFHGDALHRFTIDMIDGKPDWSSLKPVEIDP